MNIPNILTLIRVALIPIFILLFYMPFHWSYLAAAVVFTLASITDWLDGYLARKRGLVSLVGKLLDPLADKLLVMAILVTTAELKELRKTVPEYCELTVDPADTKYDQVKV